MQFKLSLEEQQVTAKSIDIYLWNEYRFFSFYDIMVLIYRRKLKMEDDWIFDSLIGFLRGPVWNVPILTYIEHKSLGNCLFYNPGFARVKTVVYNGA